MNIPCDVVLDLLPLYHDDVCNESSKKLVEAHLVECGTCSTMLEEMKNNTLDDYMVEERKNMIENHMKHIKKHFLIQGLALAMAVSIVPTFVINLATSGTLDWFFIVLGSSLLFGSITLVPMLFEKHKGLWTLVSSTVSLLLLLYVIESHVSGPYANRWFGIAAVSTLATVVVVGLIVNVLGKRKG